MWDPTREWLRAQLAPNLFSTGFSKLSKWLPDASERTVVLNGTKMNKM